MAKQATTITIALRMRRCLIIHSLLSIRFDVQRKPMYASNSVTTPISEQRPSQEHRARTRGFGKHDVREHHDPVGGDEIVVFKNNRYLPEGEQGRAAERSGVGHEDQVVAVVPSAGVEDIER